MRALMFYRPRLPGQRAQTVQVLHAADALARAGLDVTVLADRGPGAAHLALAQLGLSPHPRLHVEVAPLAHSGVAGLWFRRRVAAWWRGQPGLVIARDLARLRRLVDRLGRRQHRVVLEVHGAGPALAEEAGLPAHPSHAVEAGALEVADALVANCEGVMACWQRVHPRLSSLPHQVSHNAVAPSRRRRSHRPDGTVRLVGSLRPMKGWHGVLSALATHPAPVEAVGGSAEELLEPLPDGVQVKAAAPYTEVPDILARSAALVLPLTDNLFGRELTSPLKLFDYLAVPTPLVLPKLPSVDRALAAAGLDPQAPGVTRYAPGHAGSLRAALDQALALAPRPPTLRTWDDRLDELRPLLGLPVRS